MFKLAVVGTDSLTFSSLLTEIAEYYQSIFSIGFCVLVCSGVELCVLFLLPETLLQHLLVESLLLLVDGIFSQNN